ncbi:MAG: TetM/TetW/TetO/TetS family tetracycline resistance ribosomal protection protein [Clostridia bacterium]|nr:TetM/TetW/TetO/TetS family tetracycline resistance ribosomal protection protein [Clostridia bacterium]
MSDKHIRNVGIFAHVDAGKTTLSEQLLAATGMIRQTGSVDLGTAHTDSLPVEQRRGISVKAACVRLNWRDTEINLIDTPGHVDFSAEIERSLWALDAAVLVICAVEGVQPHTEKLFHALHEQHIPTILFINKTDRDRADVQAALHACRRLLSQDIAPVWDADSTLDAVCSKDDGLLERYLCGDIPSTDEIDQHLSDLSRSALIYPVLKGSALRGVGVHELLDAMLQYLPEPDRLSQARQCGVVFASEQDKALGRGVWVRLFSGTLENRSAITLPAGVDPLTGEQRYVQRKITQIRTITGHDTGVLAAGEIGIAYGLGDIPIGHILGDRNLLPRRVEAGHLRTPLMTVQVIPDNAQDMTALRAACQTLASEDPLLGVQYSRALNQLSIQVMGTIHLEILHEMLKTRFNLDATFSKPAVIYRETISKPAEGFVAYLAPKPCWAILRFVIEPAERGSGVTFISNVHVRDLPMQYQHQVEQALPLALAQGRLGWQVTDVRITLTEGNSHQYHTHPLDFIVATPMGIQHGLEQGGCTLLEPILDVRFLLPAECVGRVMSDVTQMRGEVLETIVQEDRVVLHALVPVATSMDYSASLASLSGGRGGMSISLHGYRDCPMELGTTAERRSVDPLDTSKYILAARSALEGGIFDLE